MRLATGPWISANSLRKSSSSISCNLPVSFAGCSPRSLKHSSSVAATLPETNARACKASFDLRILDQLSNFLVDLFSFFGALSYIGKEHHKKLFRGFYRHRFPPCANAYKSRLQLGDSTLERIGCASWQK